MELTQKEKELVISILSKADGEDMDEIVNESGFNEYLLHSLVMKAQYEELDYLILEKNNINPR